MAKFKPEAGETPIGSGTMALHQKQFLNTRSFDGTIYVTDRRACFQIRMMKDLEMDLPLEQVKGFGVKKAMMITTVTIYGREGESYAFTGFPPKSFRSGSVRRGCRSYKGRRLPALGGGLSGRGQDRRSFFHVPYCIPSEMGI